MVDDVEFDDISDGGWDYSGNWYYAVYALSLGLALFLFYQLYWSPMQQVQYGVLHLGGVLVLMSILIFSRRWNDDKSSEEIGLLRKIDNALLIAYVVVAIVATGYIYTNFDELELAFGVYSTTEYVLGAALIFICIDITRRRYGNILAGVVVFSIFYALFGYLFPGIFFHGGMSLERTISVSSLEFAGIYGSVFRIIATWVYIFVLWGGLLKAFGTIDLFIDVARTVTDHFKRGVPQVAVIGSMFMGSVIGVSLANAATTGSFTIPLMKEHGLKSETAGAIESVASTGGQVMPPVMASVGFIIAQRIGMPYGEIVVAAILPVLIFYIIVGVSVYIFTLNDGIEMPETKIDSSIQLKTAVPLIASLIFLLYVLIVYQWTAGRAGLFTVGSFILFSALMNLIYDPSLSAIKETAENTIEGLVAGTIMTAPLSVFIAAIGVVIEVMTVTGLAHGIALRLVQISGESLVILAILTMVVSLLFGLGLPTLPAFLLTISLAGPAMEQLGVDPLAASFFIFYSCILSSITPPIAVAAAVGARIAEADFLKTAVNASIIGLPLYIVPFFFLFRNELLYFEFPLSIITFVLSVIAIGIITVSFQYLYLRVFSKLKLPETRFTP